MTPPLLEIRNFECKTKQGAAVFTPLEFSLFPGDAVLVEGGSGTGKSSLLFGIRGIPLSDRKYAGDVLFNGKPASSGDRKRFGLVLQNPHAQAVSTLVKEELGEDAGEAIDILDLRGILDAPVRSLSAGQKHLASIAAAGRGEFPFIMMDEPFLYLDRDNAERALRFIDHLRNKGKCLIVTSHPGIVPRKDFTTAIEMNPPVLNGMGKDANFGEAGEDRFVDKTGALLELENADIGYPGFPAVLRGLSVSLKGGEELWIYGGNGSGKTTLLKAISGEEQLIIRGRAQCVSPEGKKPYVITQNPDRFFFESTLLQEMTAPVFFRESDLKKRGDAEKEALSILDTFGLSEKKDLSPPRISFGERLRLAAAQAAFLKPDFILVDDVLAFLGEKERGSFIQVLRRIKQERRCGLLFTTSQEIPSLMQGQRVARLDDAPCAKAENKGSGERPIISLEKQLRKTAPRRKGKRGILRFFRRKPFEYVPSNTLVHRIPAWIKLAINIGLWIMIMLSKPRRYPYVAALGLLYYLGGGLGFKRLFADTKYFILQAIFFCVVIMLFRWDAGAWRTGLLYGVRVWLIFLPMAVMMRATTTDEWTALFGKVLSAPKRIVLGISLGLLPVIVSELGEVLFVQRQKGFVLKKGDVFHPRRFWRYMKSLLVPVVIMTEDLARLAEISVILDDRKSRYFTKGEFDEE